MVTHRMAPGVRRADRVEEEQDKSAVLGLLRGALYQDVEETRGIVSGYWLNIPGHSQWCPRCTTPQPEIAVQLLRILLRPGP